MKRFIRRKFEAWLILLAAKILIGRNVHRAPFVSRRDNNDMLAMAESSKLSPYASAKAINESLFFRYLRPVSRSTIQCWHRVYLYSRDRIYPRRIGSALSRKCIIPAGS